MRLPLLLLMCLPALAGCSGGEPRPRAADTSSATLARVVTLEVGGMTCADCVQKVETQLARVPGVTAVHVSLEQKTARVTCAPGVPDTALVAAVRRAGPEYLGLIVSR